MIQYANIHSVLSAYITTGNMHVAYRIVRAMHNSEGVNVPPEAYRALCVALGRLSGRQKDGVQYSLLAENIFQNLMEAYGPLAFSGRITI